MKEGEQMPDYKSLFEKSQAEIADTIEQLEKLTEKLINCMQDCENSILEDDNNEENNAQ